jgi:hypothetical protein
MAKIILEVENEEAMARLNFLLDLLNGCYDDVIVENWEALQNKLKEHYIKEVKNDGGNKTLTLEDTKLFSKLRILEEGM